MDDDPAPAGTPSEPEPAAAPTRLIDQAKAAAVQLDQRVEAFVAPLRDHQGVAAAALVVSNLADYGFVWSTIAALKGRRRGVRRRRAVAALGVAGVTSYSLNAVIKGFVDRSRPAPAQPGDASSSERPALPDGGPGLEGRPLPRRTPSSSSFPSGHTLAAACTAVVLGESTAECAAYLLFATAVAASRVELGDHHASDVLAGLVFGAAMGAVDRALVRLVLEPSGG